MSDGCRGANCDNDDGYTIKLYTGEETDLCKTCAINALNRQAGTEPVGDDPREEDG